MLAVFIRRYRTMILVSILFYLGCGVTVSLIRIDCTDATSQNSEASPYHHKGDINVWDKAEYAVLILSGPDNEDKRDAIRTTWMNFANNIVVLNERKNYKWNFTETAGWGHQELIKFFFVIGTQGLSDVKLNKLKSENDRSNDLLLLESIEDDYTILATKMLHALRWCSTNLKRLQYLVKCDDDSFVRIDLIVRDLATEAPEMSGPELDTYVSYKNIPYGHTYKGLYWGYFNGQARVYRKGKWEENDWFLCNSYLPYALGGGYVISRSIVDYVARNADFLSCYKSEDTSMGVWTASLDAINRVHDIRFDTEWKSRGCAYYMLIRHKQSPSDMIQMYKSLVQSQGKILCQTEIFERKYYMYNWNELPETCCYSKYG